MSETGASTTWKFNPHVTVEGEIHDWGLAYDAQYYRNANQTINDNSWTALSWDSIASDYPTNWSAGNPTRFTPTREGVWHITASVQYKSTRTDFRLQAIALYVSGVEIWKGKRTQAGNSNAHWNTGIVVADLNLYPSLSHYIEVYIYQDNTGNAAINCTGWMRAVRLGSAEED